MSNKENHSHTWVPVQYENVYTRTHLARLTLCPAGPGRPTGPLTPRLPCDASHTELKYHSLVRLGGNMRNVL